MKIEVDCLDAKEWASYSEQAHLICFAKHKPVSLERIDFALVARRGDQLLGYVTCRELDGESLYWQFGGAFPGTLSTSLSWLGYQALVEHCKPRYKRISTLIENNNLVMLKMAMKVGYRIIGLRNFKGTILLEHGLEFGGTHA